MRRLFVVVAAGALLLVAGCSSTGTRSSAPAPTGDQAALDGMWVQGEAVLIFREGVWTLRDAHDGLSLTGAFAGSFRSHDIGGT